MQIRIFPVAVALAAACAIPASAQAALLDLPLNTVLPAVTGTPEAGQILGVDAGTWLYAEEGPKYQWKRCNADGQACSNVTGATASTFKLTADDAGSTLRATVTMTNLLGSTDAETPPSQLVRSAPSSIEDTDDNTGSDSTPPTTGTTGGVQAGTTGPVASKCLKIVSGRRSKKIRRVGTLRLAARKSCITKANPVVVSVRARKGTKLRSVKYRFGAKRFQTGRGRGHKLVLKPSKLRAGKQVLSVRVTPRRGQRTTVKLRVRFATA